MQYVNMQYENMIIVIKNSNRHRQMQNSNNNKQPQPTTSTNSPQQQQQQHQQPKKQEQPSITQIGQLFHDDDLYSEEWKFEHVFVQEIDHSFDNYAEMLKKWGVKINQKLQCGYFELKNGLRYAGLFTKQEINADLVTNGQGKEEILVSIPIQLLLTSTRAQKQSPKQLQQIFNTQQFFHRGPGWKNKILITYILHILSTPPPSSPPQPCPSQTPTQIWSSMCSSFSKQIDILSFWSEQDLQKFNDKSIKRAADIQRNSFQKQWKQFMEIQKKYHILQTNMYTYENYKWIYIHCVSRCFGSFLNASYFVSFCQFLNHNCVDVSYCCIQNQQPTQKQSQPNQPNPPNQPQQISDDTSLEQISSISQQSGNSEDYIESDDFSYDKVNSYLIKWNSKISYNLKQKQLKEIQNLQKKIEQMLDEDIIWKGFGLLYIGEILEKCYVIGNQYMAERKKYAQAKEELEMLGYHIRGFRKNVVKYYKGLGCTYQRDKNALVLNRHQQQKQQKSEQKPQKPTIPMKKQLPKSQNPDCKYTKFQMTCHKYQHFPKNCQVYFEYNRLSNRSLLLCYGFCLENNKYQHVWIRKSLAKEIGQYPDLFRKIQEKCLPVFYKIKLKPYVLNTQLIVTEKVQKWKIYGTVTQQNCRDFQKMFGILDLEQQCEIIDKVIQIYEDELPKYGQSMIDLTDKNLSYHNYFRSVYHNEKQRILRLQIKLLKKCKKILNRIVNEKIQIKGNINLLRQLKIICFDELKTTANVKMIWGYIKTLNYSTVS